MKALSPLQNFLFHLGGCLLIGGLFLRILNLPQIGTWIYCIGAIAFAAMQLVNRYEGPSLTIRRLRRQQILGAFLLILSGALMMAQDCQWMFKRNQWVVCLMIAAILEVYTAFRIPNELKKEE